MLARLGAMFERTASVRDESDLQEVLEDVARTIGEVLGYGAVVVNVYRPAFDDMLTAAAVGSAESLQSLLGTVSPNNTWTPLLADRFRRRDGAYFVPDGEFDWDSLGVETYVPDLEPNDHPDAWLPGDALFVPLRDARHQLLGVISVDEPQTGLRPADGELEALVTIASHAALALRIAQEIAEDMQHQRMLERVLEVSARLAEADDSDSVLQAVCDGIEDALGFNRVMICLADDPAEPLEPVAASGWGGDLPMEGSTLESLAPLFSDDYEVAGCYLLPAEVAEDRLGIDEFPYRSEMSGRGPHAWSRHWLIVPLVEGERSVGVIWVDDPRDRLLPTRARLQALRLFANQAVAAAARGHARHAHRPAEPARLQAAPGARDRRRRSLRTRAVRHGQPEAAERHARPRGGRPGAPAAGGGAAQRAAPKRRGLPARRGRVRCGPRRRLAAGGGARDAPPARRGGGGHAGRGRAARRKLRDSGARAGRRSRPAGEPGRRGALHGQAPARGECGLTGRLALAGAVVCGALAVALTLIFDPAEGSGSGSYEGGARFGEIFRCRRIAGRRSSEPGSSRDAATGCARRATRRP
jgi:GAF domain-containing protein